MDDIVQVKNPRSKRYVKIDRTKGIVGSRKKSEGPYKGIPIVELGFKTGSVNHD